MDRYENGWISKILIFFVMVMMILTVPVSAVTTIPAGNISGYVCDIPSETYRFGGNILSNETINITSGYITLDGMGYSLINSDTIPIRITSAGHVTITNMSIASADNILIDRSDFTNVSHCDMDINGADGINVNSSVYVNIEFNFINSSGNGVLLYGTWYNNIHNNVITSLNEYSAHLTFTVGSEFENNTLRSINNNSIYIYAGSGNVFSNNTIQSSAYRTTRIMYSTGIEFYNNTVLSDFENAPYDAKSISLIGDSITEGTFGYEGGWGVPLGSMLGNQWHVSNGGLAGDSANYSNMYRFAPLMQLYNTQFVCIALGTNDINGGYPQQQIIDDILSMAAAANTAGIHPYIVNTIAWPSADSKRIQLNQNLSIAASALGYNVINAYDAVDLVPMNGEYDGYNTTNYQADTYHPNTIGNTLIANVVYNAIIDDLIPAQYWYDRNPNNESCNAKVQITNSTPYMTWTFTLSTSNTTQGNVYSLYNPANGQTLDTMRVPDSYILTATGLADGVYWIQEEEYSIDNSFFNMKDSMNNNINSSFLLMGVLMIVIIGIAIIAMLASTISGKFDPTVGILSVMVMVLIGIVLVISLIMLNAMMGMIR